jgi:diguanylate cyclase (GGDEF)-like protein/PAS domain S-box-containing protein
MLTDQTIEKIERTIEGIEQRLDGCGQSFRGYRQTLEGPGTPAAAPMKIKSGEKKNQSRTSLFDGLLRDFIKSVNFQINTGSEEETNYEIIKENTNDPVVEMDNEAKILSVNPAFSHTFSCRSEELEDRDFFSLVPEEYHSGLREGMDRACREKLDSSVDGIDDIIVFRAATEERKPKSLEGIFYVFRRDDRPVLILLMRDLTFSRSLFEELQEAKDNYDALSETIHETIIRLNENFTILFVNNAVKNTFGYEREEVRDKHFSVLFPPGVFARNYSRFRKYFYIDDRHRKDLGLEVTIEVLGKSKNRGIFPMEMSFGNSKEYNGRTMTCILRDITQRKHTERKLRHLAYHDKLTGLGNRDLFNTDIRSFLETVEEHPGLHSALMFLDLDGFKQVNDTLGHEAGDKLLMEAGRRLRSKLRETDAVYRFGGDEFVVLLGKIRSWEDAGTIATKLLRTIREAFIIEREEQSSSVNVGVSIGIALIPEDGATAVSLTKNADLAMYSAKESGKNRYVFYSKEMDEKAIERWELEQGLKKGLANREFLLHFQPMVDTSGGVRGVEALVRWLHPQRGLIEPKKFVPTAEETGLIIPMGNWILETACRKMRYLNEHGFPRLYVSVNLSARQFEHPEFLNITGNIIRRAGIAPENLKLELTETCIMNAPETAIEKMHALKKQHPGIAIAIDDFGTGYSSLSYLSKLPADIIKIDLSFVIRLFQMNNQKIVNAIINLAKSLEMGIIAEGVETQEQLDYFIEKDCDGLQGRYFHMPLELKELEEVLKENPA